MLLGPFISEINTTFLFDLYEIEEVDLSASELDSDISNTINFLYGAPAASDDRSVTDVDLKVEWTFNIDTNESGITGFKAESSRIWGTITIEDLPEGADPDNLDVDLVDYVVPFDTNTNGFEIKVDNSGLLEYKRLLERGIKCNRVEVNWKKKTVEIGFDD